ncbi:hypothetical protein AB0J01_28160 [Streptomyces sp. NPDC050204]|uniref:hypothetical protein n=1 Tax=Streptomyces sp. NPDC050204 TaxID=3155514 RepID=UPI00341463A5
MTAEFTKGDRIRVIECTDPDPLPAGSTGTVQSWNPHPQVRQLGVNWDAPHGHRRLMLTLTECDGDIVEKL